MASDRVASYSCGAAPVKAFRVGLMSWETTAVPRGQWGEREEDDGTTTATEGSERGTPLGLAGSVRASAVGCRAQKGSFNVPHEPFLLWQTTLTGGPHTLPSHPQHSQTSPGSNYDPLSHSPTPMRPTFRRHDCGTGTARGCEPLGTGRQAIRQPHPPLRWPPSPTPQGARPPAPWSQPVAIQQASRICCNILSHHQGTAPMLVTLVN
ncbi:hypothetical protein SORBI_3006G260101 [Sorghum bicolor]|uniref:Uncharacterized protein n=1 Tax=Sorghum bicolor TaxID=4558 RepID=A0A1Z5RFI8_SORBI|nr:hypothetical protein SORBI_3006G260101 [Sorghum bicolor]